VGAARHLLTLCLGVCAASWSLLATSGTRAASETGPPEGLYEAEGVTTVLASGERRPATARIVLSRGGGDRYVASFNLKTALPTPDGAKRVDVTGHAEGTRDGAGLVGTAESQWLMAAIAGLDPQFPFIPGFLGPRIASRFTMRPLPDGAFRIEIESTGAPGELGRDYAPTHTVLEATRVGDKPEGRKLPLPRPRPD